MIPLDDLRAVERATVLKAGQVAGSLERRPNSVAFVYGEAYLRSSGPAVATTLPKRDAEYLTHTGPDLVSI